jgi:hypothetical protein
MSTLDETFLARPAAAGNFPGIARRPLGIVDHHMAGYLPGTTGMFQNPATGYATNLGIGSMDGETYVVHEYVPADQVAWGNGNDYLNRVAVSIEHENNRAAGYASKPTEEVHELSARVHARLAIQYDWRIDGELVLVLRDFPNHDFYGRTVPGFGTEFNVTGHRSVALKDCPRDLDMQWIVDRANQIIRGPVPTIERENADMAKSQIIVTRDDAPQFVLLKLNPAPAETAQWIHNDAQRRGAEKIVAAFNGGPDAPNVATLSGEEWDAGALDLFA